MAGNKDKKIGEICATQIHAPDGCTRTKQSKACTNILRAVYSDATQLNSTRRRVELNCVAINGPLGAQIWITQFYLQTTPCQPLSRKRSPDGATTDCGRRHLIAAHLSTPKG